MHRYGIRSFDEFTRTWSRAQLYLAIDGAFWNSAKEREKYGAVPRSADLRGVRAQDFMAVMGLPTHG